MNTIRGRILIGFLSLTLSIIIIVTMCFWTLRKHDDISAVQSRVYELQVHSLELKSACQQIIFSDAVSMTSFHDKATTPRLQFIARTFEGTKRSLQSLEQNGVAEFWEFAPDIDSISQMLNGYQLQFAQVVQLFKQRGFKDWGVEGQMRKQIHELEEDPRHISLADILQLRRHEKDYFMRNDLAYAQKLHLLVRELLAQTPEGHKEHQLLTEYRRLFADIVQIENQIGDETHGLVGEILKTQDEISEATSTLQFNIDTRANRLIADLQLILTLAVVICIITAGVASALLPPLIVKPLQKLSESMKKIIANNFRETLSPGTDKSTLEIQQLTEDYNSLLIEIRKQLSKVQQQNEELSELNDKLVASEKDARKLASLKDKFFSIISHDLRGPMSTALLFLSTLQDNPESIPPDKLKDLFKKLNENFINLNRLMVNLLTWSKSQMNAIKLVIQENHPGDIARQNLELFKESIAKKELQTSVIEEANSTCLADPNMLDFIIRNIISNAIKFTPQGGQITVITQANEEGCCITIKDTGVGMTEDQIRKIFSVEEYMTTKGTANEIGTGLGLSLCNEFIEQNKGVLNITSTPGEGSAFAITLPVPEKADNGEEVLTERS